MAERESVNLPDPDGREALAASATASVRLDEHTPLVSVGLVCTCGKALTSMELAARACACGRVWLISVMQIGGPQ